MVSELNILSRYYQIYISKITNGYFNYEGVLYYLSNQRIDEELQYYYQNYVYTMQIHGFYPIPNCFGKMNSEGYILYTYEIQNYDLESVLLQSLQMIPKEYANLKQIKNSWSRIVDEARKQVSKYASRINHNEYYVILSYYYQGLAENIIAMMNDIIEYFPDDRLPLGYEHSYFIDNYDTLFNPDNFLISTRIRDIALAYQQGCIDIKTLERYVQTQYFTQLEIMYLYIRILFPSHFFKLVVNQNIESDELRKILIENYKQLDIEKRRIQEVYVCLSKYVYLPEIHWLMRN